MRSLLAAGAVLLAVVGPAACSSADDDPREGSSGTTASDSSASTGADGATDATADGDAGSGSGSGEPGEGEVLGSSTASLPADPNDDTAVPLRLDVVALERLSGRVEARFVLTNEGEAGGPSFEPWSNFVDPRLGSDEAPWSVAGASLVDGEAQKAYLTIVDSEGVCLCSADLDALAVAPGESVELYADFGGVPDGVEQLDVLMPGFSPVTEVPLS